MDYGGRGIRVCQRWLDSFECFLQDMGPRPSAHHSIERKDNDGDYEPNNCRWATRTEQANNKRNNLRVPIGEVTKTLSQWCRERGCKKAIAWLRYSQGIRGEALFETTCLLVTHNGVTDKISGWSRRTGIKHTTLNMRLTKCKWSVARALSVGANQWSC